MHGRDGDLVADGLRERPDDAHDHILQRMGPVRGHDAVVVPDPVQDGAGHRARVRHERRRGFGVVARTSDFGEPDAEDLDTGAGASVLLHHGHLEAQRACRAHEERLSGAVRGDQRQARVRHGADVHHDGRRVAHQVRQEHARQVPREQRVQADIPRYGSLARLLQRLADRVERAPSGVVDEHREADVVEVPPDGLEVDRAWFHIATVLLLLLLLGLGCDGLGVRDDDPEGPPGERRLELGPHAR